MPLGDLIYRCPFCGAQTTSQEGGEVRCTQCSRVYVQGVGGDRLEVVDREGRLQELGVGDLVDRMSELPEEVGVLEASAVARFAFEERPVWYRGALMGFFEERGPDIPGRLSLDDAKLRFEEDEGGGHEWALLELRAVQTASASVQISPLEGGLVSFRILDDSPRRWEEVLKSRLRHSWREGGRGEIVEFQPRIRAR